MVKLVGLFFIMIFSIIPMANSIKDDGEVIRIQPMFYFWLGVLLFYAILFGFHFAWMEYIY